MAQNKLDSRKLYQEIFATKGKINLFSEYIPYYRTVLNQKTFERRAQLAQKHDQKIFRIEFYTKSDEEVLAALEATILKDKKEKLDLDYRRLRETNRRAIAKDPSQEEALNAALEEKKNANEAEYARLVEETALSIKNEKAAHANSDWEAALAKAREEREAALAAFDEKSKKADDAKFAKNEARMQKHIAKLRAKLERLEQQMQEAKKANTKEFDLADDEVLQVKDLCMYFGGLHAVDHLNFSVKNGEIYGLIGPNGAGKTTVFNCITQFYKPTAGDLSFRTKEGDIIDLNKEKVHNVITFGIARTFQNIEVIPECTVLENLLIAANRQYQSTLLDHFLHTSLLKLEEQIIAQRAFRVLQFMGLSQYAFNYAMGLPYGILKKIEIARTLMANPQLIILDEPAAGLNDSETKELAALIRRIRDEFKCTILLVEHDMGLVMDICDRICAISFGKLLAIGTPAEIQANKGVQEAYLGIDENEEVQQ